MNVLCLDIGGANLKAAHSSGATRFTPFEVWREHARMVETLESVIRGFSPFDLIVVTTTAELCDCFETKRDGVLHVLDAVTAASEATAPGKPIKVFRIDGKLVDLETARAEPLASASANWLALAIFGAGLLPKGRAVVADVGSTTTEIVPVRNGIAVPGGRTDAERLLIGELVYTGVRRTPIFAVTDRLPYHDRSCPVVAEMFATMHDAYVVTGDLVEESLAVAGALVHTSPAASAAKAAEPGGPEASSPGEAGRRNGGASSAGSAHGGNGSRATARARSRDRLARMVCADRETFDDDDALTAARFLVAAQEKKVRQALLQVAERLGGPFERAIVAGEGEFILRRAIHRVWPRCEILPFSEKIGRDASRCSCAYALAQIAAEPGKYLGKAERR